MADTAVAVSPKKTKKASKPKKPSTHPKYSEMIRAAIAALKERGGSSRQAILKYILKNYTVGDEKSANSHLKLALRAGAKNGSLKQSKGAGASGSFKIGEKPKTVKAKKTKSPKKDKKVTKPKKAATTKKTTKPKKPAAKKPAKKAAAKKPAAKKPKAKKPKTAKPKAAKKPAAKKAAKK